MKSSFSPDRLFTSIEPLEARIAPAVISAGAPGKGDTNYSNSPFVDLETASDQIAQAVGKGEVGVHDTFYLRLSAGDTLKIFNPQSNFEDFLKVTSGQVIGFFVDKDGNDEVSVDELVGLAIGKNAAFQLQGGINGDILSILDDHGTKTTADDTLDLHPGTAGGPATSGLVSGKQSVQSIYIGSGDVTGSIIAGGNISKVTSFGRVGNILTGSAANGVTFDLFPGVPGGEGTVAFTPTAGLAGGSISNVVVDGVDRIEAGSGGASAVGGSIKNVKILEDFDGLTLKSGNGGAGLGKLKGGAGGSISNVYMLGVQDPSPGDSIQFITGNGGDSNSGVGGAGGSISTVFVGYDLIGNKPFISATFVNDSLSFVSGHGGIGKIGGKGGAVSHLTLVNSAAGDGDEISVIAGHGGDSSLAGGKAGIGGSISDVKARDLNQVESTSVLVHAGDGGGGGALAAGGSGGSLIGVRVLAGGVTFLGGLGGGGTTGGNGGSLTSIEVEQDQGIVATSGIFNAGSGGDGSKVRGGAGGNIVNLKVDDGDFSLLQINSGTSADGGASTQGLGGVGGFIRGLDFTDSDIFGNAMVGTAFVRTGNGGAGFKAGGNAGAFTNSAITSEDLSLDIATGNGGSLAGALANGRGGNAGIAANLQIFAAGEISEGDAVTAILHTGAGGAGLGAKGAGGAGGDILSTFVTADGSVSALAGSGGSGADSAGVGNSAGRGGSIQKAGAFSKLGDGTMVAGDGGLLGTKPGNGGSIVGGGVGKLSGLFAAGAVTVKAGNGTNGGAGGSVTNFGYGSSASNNNFTPSPSGDILVQAGNGSAEGKFAGPGGSIVSVAGSVSSSSGTHTRILAGLGGSGALRASAGGSIINLAIQRGGSPIGDDPATDLMILAGDAGDAGASAKVGASGGDVRNVRISGIDESGDTIIRSIAAGDGGDAGTTGGQGGSINGVRVLDHDIGVRQGADYGFDSMGGLFAGIGGSGSVAGKPGDVVNVLARSIAAIVAGRGAAPQMAGLVEDIYVFSTVRTGLTTTDLLKYEPEPGKPSDLDLSEGNAGDPNYYAFVQSAYNTANLVGAVSNPTRVDGNMFAYTDTNGNGKFDLGEVPTDGLVAAQVFNQARVNFTPEARIVAGVFYDYDNRNS